MILRCYLEITNICNLNCVFCPKTRRPPQTITAEQFDAITDKLRGEVKYLYLHLMGEPLLHPLLPQFIETARSKGFLPIVTTNGTLLSQVRNVAESKPYKVQISLHSHEANTLANPETYIGNVARFAAEAAAHGTIVVLRLWNKGGYDECNRQIEQLLASHFPEPWTERHDGYKLAENIYLEHDSMFNWPDSDADECNGDEVFCYALRNQIGVLVDGTVVPCCLDHDGELALGNLHQSSLSQILASPLARAIYHGFTSHNAVEPLCRRCGYAAVTKRFRQ
ncbi:MAG: radical SAM/SPASM domain-containing protein [Muribaculaceae bacterium]